MMKRVFRDLLQSLSLVLACAAPATHAEPGDDALSFAVIANDYGAESGGAKIVDAIQRLGDKNLAFIVANGIKARGAPCSDELLIERRDMLDSSRHGLLVSLSSSDWTSCRSPSGKHAAVERLNRMRELYFSDGFSLGASKVPVARQSVAPKFRNYSENARWLFRNILFATVNLPANNNNFIPDAGRNSEFEDRAIANQDWLKKIFTLAARKKLDAIVLFSDANPLRAPSPNEIRNLPGRRDGYREFRKQLAGFSARFPGKVLVVHGERSRAGSGAIRWTGNMGELGVAEGWAVLQAQGAPVVFRLEEREARAVSAP